jgi:hypothetical protein
LESSIQKRKTPENQNSIDVHLRFLPVYDACLGVPGLHYKRLLILREYITYKKEGKITMKNRIKKMITITLATVSIIGNVTSAPVQAAEYTESVKAAPIVQVVDCNDLTEEMLTTRKEKNIMYIERIIGKVTDNAKNGKVLNPPVDGGYYISYASVEDAEIGDTIITYCVYNPYTNYDDDVIERWDFIQ